MSTRGPTLVQLFSVIALFGVSVPAAFVGGMKYQETQKAPEPVAKPVDVEYPKWINQGSGVHRVNDSFVFYGVGSASGIRNASLARSTADNRARAEISKIFEIHLATAVKRLGDDPTQEVQTLLKTSSANTLNGVEIVDHWIHPQTGEIYTLARLDPSMLMTQLQRAKLEDAMKTKLLEATEGALKDLEAEEAHGDL